VSVRYLILCLIALLAITILAMENYETWTRPLEVGPEKAVPKKPPAKTETPAGAPASKEAAPAATVESYVQIASKNIFSPERKDFPILMAADPSKEVKKPVVRPQAVLYGVTIAGDYKSASIAITGRPLQRGEREVNTYRVGDKLGEYKVAKILPDRISLEAQDDQFEVLLYDARAPKKRVVARTETKPATITSTLPAPPPGAPVAGSTQPFPPGVPRPGEPARGVASEAHMPRSITPAATPMPTPTPAPTPRARRWYGPAPSPLGPVAPGSE
jgi:hypothetical protein